MRSKIIAAFGEWVDIEKERERGNQFDKYANISFTQIRCANCFIGTYYATTTVNHLCPMAEI